MSEVHFALEDGQEIDAAVSAVLNQAPAILPFSEDRRGREKLQQWLREDGLTGDLSRMPTEKLLQTVMMRWLAGVREQHGQVQIMGGPTSGRYVATNGVRSGWSTESPDIAVARLVLMLKEPGYRRAVKHLMQLEEETASADDAEPEWP